MDTRVGPMDAVEQRLSALSWYHRIDLGGGLITPGRHDPAEFLSRIGLPSSLSGKSVLDVGAWDGFYSFEAERRGADRVLATDSFCWGGEGWGSKAGFELAREVLGSRVEDLEIDVLDVSPESTGCFDVVLFLGVLYHMRHPLLALERVASVTREMLIVETAIDLPFVARPAVAFYPDRELEGEASNWWAPNPAALVAMCRAVGFRRVEIFYQPTPWTRLRGTLARVRRGVRPWFFEWIRNRATVHAWK